VSKQIDFRDVSQMPSVAISLGDMLWNKTGSWRYMRPKYEDKTPPCNAACPAGVDIVGFMNLARVGEFEKAWRLLREENPLPGVCGRACFHPCEGRCNRGEFDEAVAINSMERFLADYGARFAKGDLGYKGKVRQKVAIVGSGPAGLSCAYFLAKMGYRVTVFEALPQAGGILRVGIPPYRLPKDVLEVEIAAIEALGVKIETNCRVGEDIKFEQLKEYAAIFIAVGVHKSKRLNISG